MDKVLDKPGARDSGTELGYLSRDISFLTRAVRAHLRTEGAHLREEFGAQPGEIAIINLIAINPGITQNEVAATVVLKKSAVTRVIHSLEERNLVSRTRVRRDKRFNALNLTEAGEAKVKSLKARMDQLHQRWLAGFSDVERDLLFDFLHRIVANLTRT